MACRRCLPNGGVGEGLVPSRTECPITAGFWSESKPEEAAEWAFRLRAATAANIGGCAAGKTSPRFCYAAAQQNAKYSRLRASDLDPQKGCTRERPTQEGKEKAHFTLSMLQQGDEQSAGAVVRTSDGKSGFVVTPKMRTPPPEDLEENGAA